MAARSDWPETPSRCWSSMGIRSCYSARSRPNGTVRRADTATWGTGASSTSVTVLVVSYRSSPLCSVSRWRWRRTKTANVVLSRASSRSWSERGVRRRRSRPSLTTSSFPRVCSAFSRNTGCVETSGAFAFWVAGDATFITVRRTDGRISQEDIMAIWNTLKRELDKAGQVAQGALDEGKLRLEAHRAKQRAEAAAASLGFAVYRARAEGGELEPERYRVLAETIASAEADMARL